MNHVVLLGDSIFDNAAYVHGSPDVITHLNSILSQDWKVTLLAVDGTAVNIFNDCILREAITHGLPVIDLRLICTEPGDYANEIGLELLVAEDCGGYFESDPKPRFLWRADCDILIAKALSSNSTQHH